MNVTWKCKPNECFPSQVMLDHGVYHSSKNPKTPLIYFSFPSSFTFSPFSPSLFHSLPIPLTLFLLSLFNAILSRCTRNLRQCWDNWWPTTPLFFSIFLGLPCVCAVASQASLCLPQRLMLHSGSLVGNSMVGGNSMLMRLVLAAVKSWSCGVGPVPTGSELKPPPMQFLPH